GAAPVKGSPTSTPTSMAGDLPGQLDAGTDGPSQSLKSPAAGSTMSGSAEKVFAPDCAAHWVAVSVATLSPSKRSGSFQRPTSELEDEYQRLFAKTLPPALRVQSCT